MPVPLEILAKGRDAWNAWRREAEVERPDLCNCNLSGGCLAGFDLSHCDLNGCFFLEADLRQANLAEADLSFCNLTRAQLDGANLTGAVLFEANLTEATLNQADLRGAKLYCASLVRASLAGADIRGSHIYGVSAWDTDLTGLQQAGLVITPPEDPEITVDQIEMAQFLNLVAHNRKVHDALETLTSKLVLLLGRFSEERKEKLEALRGELRRRGFVPIVFDFDKPARRTLTETVLALASLACFIIADITDPESVPAELEAIVTRFRSIPVTLIQDVKNKPYALTESILDERNVRGLFSYADTPELLQLLDKHLDDWRRPVERKAAV